MNLFAVIAGILCFTALLSYLNAKWLRFPDTIGVMVMALGCSAFAIAVGSVWEGSLEAPCRVIEGIDFSSFVLDVALAFLIFAGAFGINTQTLNRERVPVLIFATFGIVVSTFLVGGLTWLLLGALGLETPFIHCMLFGALISPTDPIAVLAILKQAGVPKDLEADVAGESLLNDGVAVVVFLTIYHMAEPGGGHFGAADVAALFGKEVIGGTGLGLLLGWFGYRALKSAMNPTLDVMITLAIVMGGYALAGALHFSGPLAMVAAGLVMSAGLAKNALGVVEQEHVDIFWESVDEILNAVLFVLVGSGGLESRGGFSVDLYSRGPACDSSGAIESGRKCLAFGEPDEAALRDAGEDGGVAQLGWVARRDLGGPGVVAGAGGDVAGVDRLYDVYRRALFSAGAGAERGETRQETRPQLAGDLLPVGDGFIGEGGVGFCFGEFGPFGAGVAEEAVVVEVEFAIDDLVGLRINLNSVTLEHGPGAIAAGDGDVLGGIGREGVAIFFAGEVVGGAIVFGGDGGFPFGGRPAEVTDGVIALDGEAVLQVGLSGRGGAEGEAGRCDEDETLLKDVHGLWW